MTIERKIFGGFGIALAVLLGIVMVAYHSTNEFLEASRLVAHTHEVLTELEETLSLMKDAGFGHRGYVITGDEQYLESYDAAVRLMPDQIKQIRSLTADNLAQQRRLDALEPLIMKDFTFRAETIRLQRTRGAEVARRNVQTGVGKRGIEAIRQLTKEMEKEEHDLLSRRSAEAEQRARITIAVIVLGGLLALALVVSASVVVRRALDERKRIEEEICELNRDLERRVVERTVELEAVNKELKTMAYKLEQRVEERTVELQRMVNLMAGREVRMAELKDVMGRLRAQLATAGLTPVRMIPGA